MRAFLFSIVGLWVPAAFGLVQPAYAEKLPDFSDVISVRMPEGYRYAGGEGVFNRFTYHYLPEQADREGWQEKVTLLGLGEGGLTDAALGKLVEQQVVRARRKECAHGTLDRLDTETTTSYRRIDYSYHCQLSATGQRPTDSGQMHELVRYRVLTSKSGSYLFSYHWYGDTGALTNTFEKDPKAFWERARGYLDHFNVCDLARSTTCWVDRDVMGTDSLQETDTSLRCQDDPAAPCNPTAILIFRAKNPMAVVDGAPRGTGILQMDRQDLTSASLALSLLKVVKKSLDEGAPEFALVVKPSANPDHDVTFRERATIAAFFNLMGETAVQEDIAESYGSLMLNFHPGRGRLN